MNFKNIAFIGCLLLLSLAVQADPAQPTAPKSLGKYGNWQAYETIENGNKVCFMLSVPKKSDGKYAKRGDVYAVITHRPALKSKDVISIHMGYGFTQGEEVNVTIKSKTGTKKYDLFTEGETAWCIDDKTDQDLTSHITGKGAEMIVEGQSSRGTNTKDTFSLSGSLKAYKAICKACGRS
jgi:hypothetical protein